MGDKTRVGALLFEYGALLTLIWLRSGAVGRYADTMHAVRTILIASLALAACGKKAEDTGAGASGATGTMAPTGKMAPTDATGSTGTMAPAVDAGATGATDATGDTGSGSAAAAPPANTTVQLANAKGESVGSAILSTDDKGVAIALDLKGLPPGDHAIHVHETPKCDAPDFKSAGSHWNPHAKKHGMDNPDGPHAGDMANINVAADGTAKMTIIAPGVTYDRGEHSVFGGAGGTTGTALVIHAAADDMKSDPAGNAGDRIACGLITP